MEGHSFGEWWRLVRRTGTPLVCVQTQDPLGVLGALAAIVAAQAKPGALLAWDCLRGLRASNLAAEALVQAQDQAQLEDTLKLAPALPERAILLLWLQREHLDVPETRQGILNVRDVYKSTRRTLVLLVQGAKLPPELAIDVLEWVEPLPGESELGRLVDVTYAAARQADTSIAQPEQAQRNKIIDAVRGLSAFRAEQELAMSMRQKIGISAPALWQGKLTAIGQVPGLQAWKGGERFAALGGLEGLKADLLAEIAGREPLSLVLWLDEGERSMAGTEGDLTGISQDFEATLLTHLQDTRARGAILVGHAGTGKSTICKAMAAEADLLCLRLDMNACKGSLVGESERNLRRALQIEQAIAGGAGRTYWLLTCNGTTHLSSPFKSRYDTIWMFDFPTEQEQLLIWSIYRKRYEISAGDDFPACDEWTGREIERCCRIAYRRACTLRQAARSIVPVAISDKRKVAELRTEACAHGYLDAQTSDRFTWQAGTAAYERAISFQGA